MSGLNDEGPQERFEEFLRTYKDEEGKLAYWSRLQQMSINDESSIVVNFQDLASFDSVFITLATEDPIQFLKMINGALVFLDAMLRNIIDTLIIKIENGVKRNTKPMAIEKSCCV